MSIYEYDEEKHMRQTREEGFEDGYETGHKSGYKDGLETGIKTLIQTCHDLAHSKQEVEEILCERFSLSSQEADEYMKKYWIS